MTKSVKKALLPQLRFPEFRDSGGWEVKTVGNIFEVTRGYVLSMSLVKDERTKLAPYPVFSSQTKNNGLAGYYTDFLYENAITWTTDGANAGDVNYRSGKFYCTNVCGVLISPDGYANLCIAALINSVSKNHVSYVGNPKLMNGVMSKIIVPIPLLKEQQKIAACLSSLDDLITAQGQKVAILKAHKKGLMQQLFPAEGETVPKLRFPEFRDSGGWEVEKLEVVCDVLNNMRKPITSSNRKRGRYPYYGASGIVDYVEDYIFDERLLLIGEDGAKWGAFENTAFIVEGKYWVNNHAHVLRAKKINGIFLENYLVMLDVAPFITGAAPPKLTLKSLNNILIPVPTIMKEQQKIAACLSSIDDLITAQGQKVAILKAHKKGLMQQLFPSYG